MLLENGCPCSCSWFNVADLQYEAGVLIFTITQRDISSSAVRTIDQDISKYLPNAVLEELKHEEKLDGPYI